MIFSKLVGPRWKFFPNYKFITPGGLFFDSWKGKNVAEVTDKCRSTDWASALTHSPGNSCKCTGCNWNICEKATLSRLRYLKHFATSLPQLQLGCCSVANASYTVALFVNMLFVFICVWTVDSVDARLRLPFFDVARKVYIHRLWRLLRSHVVKTVTSVYIHSSEKSCFVQNGRMVPICLHC